ncbi:Aquaporin-1 [Clarireedia jacksonii]
MFFTIELVFTILMLAAEKTKATFVAPVGIGLALFVGVYWTGGALNPARTSLEVFITIIGSTLQGVRSLLGALLAAGFYKLIKALNYEEVNGSQDLSAEEVEDKDEKAKKKREEKEHIRARLFHHHPIRHLRGHHHTANPTALNHYTTGAEQGIRRASTGGFHSHRGHHHTAHPTALNHQTTGAEQGIRRASTGGFHSHRGHYHTANPTAFQSSNHRCRARH